MPKLLFRASLLTFDKDLLKRKLNAVLFIYLFIYLFILRKGKDKIKRLALVSDYSDGGLKMPYLESTIKAQEFYANT